MTYADEVLADSPVGYWRLGESSGTTVVDETANGLDGTYIGGPTLGQAGLVDDANTAVLLDGTDDYIVLNAAAAALSGAFAWSFEMWFKAGSQGGAGGGVLWAVNTSAGGNVMLCRLDATTPSGAVSLEDNADSATEVTSAAYADDARHHLVFARESGFWRFYLDGVEVLSHTDSNDTLRVSSTDKISIGQEFDAGAASDFLAGVVDEIAIYDSTLSATRVSAHYAARLGAGGEAGVALAETLPAITESFTLRSYTPTDTTNGRSGRIRGGYTIHADNTDPVTLPAAAATRRDKALWYPETELVDGRPVGPPVVPPDPESSVIPQTIPFTIGA